MEALFDISIVKNAVVEGEKEECVDCSSSTVVKDVVKSSSSSPSSSSSTSHPPSTSFVCKRRKVYPYTPVVAEVNDEPSHQLDVDTPTNDDSHDDHDDDDTHSPLSQFDRFGSFALNPPSHNRRIRRLTQYFLQPTTTLHEASYCERSRIDIMITNVPLPQSSRSAVESSLPTSSSTTTPSATAGSAGFSLGSMGMSSGFGYVGGLGSGMTVPSHFSKGDLQLPSSLIDLIEKSDSSQLSMVSRMSGRQFTNQQWRQ